MENFKKVIERPRLLVKIAVKSLRIIFPTSEIDTDGKGAKREIGDISLTRYACYLIAQKWRPEQGTYRFCHGVLRCADAQAGTH